MKKLFVAAILVVSSKVAFAGHVCTGCGLCQAVLS